MTSRFLSFPILLSSFALFLACFLWSFRIPGLWAICSCYDSTLTHFSNRFRTVFSARMVELAVLSMRYQLQILYTVIADIAVYMMYKLGWQKLSAELALHKIAMLPHSFPVHADRFIIPTSIPAILVARLTASVAIIDNFSAINTMGSHISPRIENRCPVFRQSCLERGSLHRTTVLYWRNKKLLLAPDIRNHIMVGYRSKGRMLRCGIQN